MLRTDCLHVLADRDFRLPKSPSLNRAQDSRPLAFLAVAGDRDRQSTEEIAAAWGIQCERSGRQMHLRREHAFAFARMVSTSDRRSAARASSTHKNLPERVRNSVTIIFALARIDSTHTSRVGLVTFTNAAQDMQRRWQYSA